MSEVYQTNDFSTSTQQPEQNNLPHTNLSVTALGMILLQGTITIISFIMLFLGYSFSVSPLLWIGSIFLAWFSKMKYKDRLADTVILIDLIYLVVSIVLAIIVYLFAGAALLLLFEELISSFV